MKLLSNPYIKYKKNYHYSPYKARDKYLKHKFNRDYVNYLKSKKWLEVRNRVLERDQFKCVICLSEKKLHVHHLLYSRKTLGGKTDYWLITVCNKCHLLIHGVEKNKKVTPRKATEMYIRSLGLNPKSILRETSCKNIRKQEKNRQLYKKYGVFGMQARGLL